MPNSMGHTDMGSNCGKLMINEPHGKKSYLSFGRQTIVIKDTLANLLIYCLTFFKILAEVAISLRVWEGDRNKIYLVILGGC